MNQRARFITTGCFVVSGLIVSTHVGSLLSEAKAALWDTSIQSQIKRDGVFLLSKSDFERIKHACHAAYKHQEEQYHQLGLRMEPTAPTPEGSVTDQAQKAMIQVIAQAKNINNLDPTLAAQQITQQLVQANSNVLNEEWKRDALQKALYETLHCLKASATRKLQKRVKLSHNVDAFRFAFLRFFLYHSIGLRVRFGEQQVTIDWIEPVTGSNYRQNLITLLHQSQNEMHKRVLHDQQDLNIHEQARYGYLRYSNHMDFSKKSHKSGGKSLHLVLRSSMLD